MMKRNELYTLDCNILEQMKHVHKINLNNNPIIVSTELTKVSDKTISPPWFVLNLSWFVAIQKHSNAGAGLDSSRKRNWL